MDDTSEQGNNLPLLSEAEEVVLKLYDQVQELQLQLALIRSRQNHRPNNELVDNLDPVGDQMQLLEAKALHLLRKVVAESVMIAPPTLRAVHHATHASPSERDLLASVQQRDATAGKAAQACAEMKTAWDSLADLQVQRLQTMQKNIELASEALSLAQDNHANTVAAPEDRQLQTEIAALESRVRTSRQRWRVIKGAASAIVAGSGVDWVRDDRLKELVLDPAE